MTNKNKAKELAKQLLADDQNQQPLIDVLLQMAQWKERQIVNKAVEWIKENITYTDNGTKKCLVNLGPFIDAIMEEQL